jgi:hypothetical protein
MSKFTVEDAVDAHDWDAFVSSSPHGSPFLRSDWIAGLGLSADFWLVHDKAGPCVGAAILRDDDGPIERMSGYYLYNGVLLGSKWSEMPLHSRPSWIATTLEPLMQQLTDNYPHFVLGMHPGLVDLRPFQWFNWDTPDAGTFDLNLRYTARTDLREIDSPDNFLRSVRTLRRRQVTRARKQGFTIARSDDVDQLDRLHKLTFARQDLDRPAGPGLDLLGSARAALKGDFAWLYVAQDPDGKPVAANLILLDETCGYYIYGATDPDFRNSGVGSLILFSAIEDCWRSGRSAFDHCGANSPQRGDFKTSFNAIVEPYHVVTWNGSDASLENK